MNMEILGYEAQWYPGGDWEPCSESDYVMITQSAEDQPERSRSKARVIGVASDPAGLLLPGPEKYKTWREAAVREKGRRVEVEQELAKVREELEKLKSNEELRSHLFYDMQDSQGHALHCMENMQKVLAQIATLSAPYKAKENG